MADSKLKIWITDKVSLTGLNKLTTTLSSVKKKISAAFNTKTVRNFKIAVAAVVTALVAAGKSAVDFNVQIARVNTMSEGTLSNFKLLRTMAKSLASEYGLAATSISTAMYNALSAGVSQSNLESVLGTAAQIAVADGSDISVAIDGITTVLNAFGYEAEESQAVADKLFQTVKEGKTTFGELASSIATVAPVAAASNIPLEEILAHVASLTAQGAPTAQAMTQIRASIIGLNKALGDGWADNMTYQEALKKVWSLAGESQTKLLEMVGSTEAVQAVLGGVGEKAALAQDKLDSMADSAGNVKDAFDQVDQFRHWSSFITSAWEMLKTFGAEVDERLAPYVRQVTEEIQKWQQDQGLWDKIAGFLDTAESKLQSVVSIAAQIDSMQDVGTVLGVAGDWLKDKLIEGGTAAANKIGEIAPEVGATIAEAMQNYLAAESAAEQQASQEMFGSDKPSVFSKAYWGLDSDYNSAVRSKMGDIGAENTGAASISIDDASQQSLAERITAALSADNESANNISVADILAAGPTPEELDELITGMELTAEEIDQIIEYTDDASEAAADAGEAAKSTAEAATKASEATTESNKIVEQVLTSSTTASLQLVQVASATQSQVDSITNSTMILAGRQAQLEQMVNNLAGQISMLQV